MDKQRADFEWFVKNMPKLYKKYGDCYLAIKNKKVIGVYSSYNQGVKETAKSELLGTFIIQQCGKDSSVYTVEIFSPNVL